MKSRSRAFIRVTPDTILPDIDRLVELAGVSRRARRRQDDDPQGQHLLALPVPGREHHAVAARRHDPGAARAAASRDQVCVQNKTVVTNAFKGEDLNHYVPIFKRYDDPRPLQLQGRGHDVGAATSRRRRCACSITIFPEGIHIPDYFFGKNIVHLPTTKCHIYTTTTGAMKNAFGGLLNTRRHYTHSWIHETLVDLLAIQKEIHSGPVRDHGRHDRRQRPGSADDVPGGEERDAGVGRSGGDRRGVGEDDGLRSDVARLHPAGARGRPRRRRSARTSRSSATSTRRRRTGSSTSARTWCASAAAT